jgi:hypothetical protein
MDQLVQKAPIGAVGDDLLRARLDETHFVQPQRIEPERVLGVVFTPFVIRIVVQRLQRVIIALRETPIDELPGGARRITDKA